MQFPAASVDASLRPILAPAGAQRVATLSLESAFGKEVVLQVRKIAYSPNTPYLVHVPPSLQNVEGAKRRFFDKEIIAKTYVKRLSQLLGDYQLQALGLTDAQKLEASECFARLEGRNGSLRSAVDFYLQRLEEANRSLSSGALVDEFLAIKSRMA